MKIDLKNEVTPILKNLRKELQDSEKRMIEASKVIQEEIKKSFNEKKSFEGIGWAPPKESTKKLGFKEQLNKTGKLKKSIQNGKRIQNGFEFKSDLKYASVQQFGNKNNKIFGKANAPIPARPFIPVNKANEVSEKTTKEVVKLINKRIQKIIGERTNG